MELQELLSEGEVAQKIEALARRLAPRLSDETVGVCLLTGGLWFAADLMRALHRLGRSLLFDALWLASYGDARSSSGTLRVHAPLQRPLGGRQALIMDDVLETGLSLAEARRLVAEAGAGEILTAVFAEKPSTGPRMEADFSAWRAPPRFLVGYGMDAAGAQRGRPGLAALP
jgi:hypoxanthine phosphoribosyltransferase